MPTLVRNLNNFHWLDPVGGDPAEPQADALKIFQTTDNEVSVYEVTDSEYDAARLAVAVIAKASRPEKVDFVVFDRQLATQLDISIRETAGETLDTQANNRHRHLLIGTAKKLHALTEAIFRSPKARRLQKHEVAELLLNAIDNGSIDEQELAGSMQEQLKKYRQRIAAGGNE